ncbi:cytotoxic T-lymphocyte protein 4-like isoform X1 [Sardina pilchardus]|uniref:cytotoxic T-lymphocyte protein 4-like isoform X1 n=1 Tax=Sardina pilchardus TaxID=27697 RepID=UPI002E0D3164
MYNSLIIASLVYLATPAVNGQHIVQPYRVVATEGQATIECRYASPPRHQPQELHVTLLKGLYGDATVCSDYLNSTARRKQTPEPNACVITLSERGVNVTVAKLKGVDTDMYRCMVKVLMPPPYLVKRGNGTLVYVPEKLRCSMTEMQYQAPTLDQGTTETTKEGQGLRVTCVALHLPLVVAIGILILGVCVITITICQVKRITTRLGEMVEASSGLRHE